MATTSRAFDADVLEHRREKPWIAAVDSFAIGGTCQWLLVMDYVIAETGSYFVLPARKEGIIPGCANLRLPRFVGERIARQALFFNRSFPADSPEGLMLADEVVPAADMEAAIRHAASEVVSAGTTSLIANRLALRQCPGAARPVPALHEQLRPSAGRLPLQPGPDRQPRAQLERQEPLAGPPVRCRTSPTLAFRLLTW